MDKCWGAECSTNELPGPLGCLPTTSMSAVWLPPTLISSTFSQSSLLKPLSLGLNGHLRKKRKIESRCGGMMGSGGDGSYMWDRKKKENRMCVLYLLVGIWKREREKKQNIILQERAYRFSSLGPRFTFQISRLKFELTTDQEVFYYMGAMTLLCAFLGSHHSYLQHLLLITFEHFGTCGGLI